MNTNPLPPPSSHRQEIDGLRAVAVLLVAVYHVWFGRVSGGVDVFLLLTGFLVTGSLVRAAERGGFHYGAFLGRLAVRLVPTAALVIAVSLLGARLLLPEARWRDTVAESLAAAFHHLNWHLAFGSVDYLARDDATSVFQHFWSLSVQGQFYLVWPVVVGLAFWWAARLGRPAQRVLLAVLSTVFALSLAYSVLATRVDQPWAYFDTGARLWEFALGGLLALLLPYLRPPRALRVLLGWLGLAALALCGVLLQVSTVFPGYAALWPTLAAAAVIVAGATGSPWGADRWLTLRPVLYLGSISYALYLWHWPILVFHLAVTGRDLASPLGGIAVLALSIGLAAVTTPLADRIVAFGRAGTRLRPPVVAAAFLVPVLLATGAWTVRMDAEQRRLEEVLADPARYPGAVALPHDDPGAYPDPVHPPPASAARDLPVTYDDGCNQSTSGTEAITCDYGASDPDRTVALVGGSHAAHWFPALEQIAQRRDWRLVNITKGACLFTDAPQLHKGEPYTECAEWNGNVLDELRSLRPDAVFTTGTTTSLDTSAGFGEEVLVDGYVDRWRELEALGIEVVAVRDTPRLPFAAPDCLSESDPEGCSAPPGHSLAEASPLEGAELPANVTALDLTDLLCEPDLCRPVVGNVLVYWDASHITATYMRTLAPELERRLLLRTG
ncbi:acyltransferase family protein [Nocardiopsis sp. L17-MgMaSL7]|uniref:acyltransferase family protein n=1 Tax=Nocardiopsis sp. L17-MgMaSL7 TaxID=1938893 RepID=UPI000D712F47|nr:acyltransferase family protein [Nocardiopsis sp. L17-MgMaSL7]PWV44307.1 peptidoglycan/LPS O-acetylase OafA/YrhL [Nocardiopsis sp. L17-MgMaSL7]